MILPELPPDIERVLRDYQRTPCRQLLRALDEGPQEWGYPGAGDLSDVGTGKTYTDLGAMLATGRQVIVLCPVVGVGGWEKAFDLFGARPRYIGSYEAVRGGWRPEIGKHNVLRDRFEWKDAAQIGLILDEAHLTKGQDSLTTKTIGGAIYDNVPMIAASATMATSPVEMRILGRITGLHNGGRDWQRWILENGARWDDMDKRWTWDSRQSHVLDRINEILIPARGCRVKKADMGDQPGTTLAMLPLRVPEAAEIEAAWAELEDKVEAMKRKHCPREQITNYRRGQRMKIWKRSELALVEPVAARVKACLAEGKSVVVFFSFTESRERMGKIFNTRAGFYGGQNPKHRKHWEAEFQANRCHLLLCNIGSGGASVSLHDTTGERVRETFIFPTDKAVQMGQAPGRCDRNGGKTHTLQWIPCIAGGFSQKMVQSTARKLGSLATFNDGDGPRLFTPTTHPTT